MYVAGQPDILWYINHKNANTISSIYMKQGGLKLQNLAKMNTKLEKVAALPLKAAQSDASVNLKYFWKTCNTNDSLTTTKLSWADKNFDTLALNFVRETQNCDVCEVVKYKIYFWQMHNMH